MSTPWLAYAGVSSLSVIRFLVLAFALLILTMAIFAFTLDTLDLLPSGHGADFRFGVSRLPPAVVLGTWALEAMALIALFLLIEGRAGSWWLDGLAAGWSAWVFRGPLLVLTVAAATRLPPDPWWAMVLQWFLLYSISGLILALLARAVRLER